MKISNEHITKLRNKNNITNPKNLFDFFGLQKYKLIWKGA